MWFAGLKGMRHSKVWAVCWVGLNGRGTCVEGSQQANKTKSGSCSGLAETLPPEAQYSLEVRAEALGARDVP